MWKRLVVLLFVLSSCLGANAQTFAEWFSQKKTQKKYLIQQIALLQLYLGYAKKGYDIAKNGLSLIGDIKDGDFNLHNGYFNSLQTVSSKVRNYDKVVKIGSLFTDVRKIQSQSLSLLRSSLPNQAAYRSYAERVYAKLLDDVSDQVGILISLLTDGYLLMKEDERLSRIDNIYSTVLSQYAFARAFEGDNRQYLFQYAKEQSDLFLINKMYEIE